MTVRTRTGVQTVVQDYQVTNDLDIAARIARGDAAAQALAKQTAASQLQAFEKQQQEKVGQQAANIDARQSAGASVEAQRQAKIASIRAKIVKAKKEKAYLATLWHPQREVAEKEAEIRALQQQLSNLGVTGAALE
jgi:hypothetical protein